MNIRDGIYGVAVGDAYGVPFEFLTAEDVQSKIRECMIGNGTHKQEKGTWSDDTSLTLCILDNIDREINYKAIMESFVQWYKYGKYTADGYCFDIGLGTKKALFRYMKGVLPTKCGGTSVRDNGNGSLMRCLPIAYYLYCSKEGIRRDVIHNISSLTHGNEISLMACDMYVTLGYKLLEGLDVEHAYVCALQETIEYWGSDEIEGIKALNSIPQIEYRDLSGSGYVISTLQAAIWCLLNTTSYKECIHKCVKIGGDTDTIASIAGGLAGIVYGRDSIPRDWIRDLKNKELLESICSGWEERFNIEDI